MVKKITKKDINKVKIKLVQKYKPQRIILFGSFGWGKPNRDSDVDLFLVKNTKKKFHQRQIEVRKLIDGEIPVDILVYTPKELKNRLSLGDFFIKKIITKGKCIYEPAK